MKTISNKTAELQAQNQLGKQFMLKRAIVAELQYDNGTTSEVISFFNEETDFELIVSGLTDGFKKQNNVSSVKFTVCSVENGILKPWASYERQEFDYDEKMKATKGAHIFYVKRKHIDELNKIMKENNITHNHTSEYAYPS